jgi:outer membrane protein OmpA-like peptidoglycan-associated protein
MMTRAAKIYLQPPKKNGIILIIFSRQFSPNSLFTYGTSLEVKKHQSKSQKIIISFKRGEFMKTRKLGLAVALFASVMILLPGCAANNKVKGGAIGAGAGGVIGAIIGNQTGNKTTGAIIGAAVGGTAGVLIGRNMDKQAEELKKVQGAKVERVGEGIQLTMESGILFQTNQAALQTQARQNIQKIADVLKKYPDTDIIVAGHTDSDGTEEYNQKLSERRAQAVTDYLKGLGVSGTRLKTVGYGETQPVADNGTAEGKAANRRVEIAVMANEKMKQAAEAGKLQ